LNLPGKHDILFKKKKHLFVKMTIFCKNALNPSHSTGLGDMKRAGGVSLSVHAGLRDFGQKFSHFSHPKT